MCLGQELLIPPLSDLLIEGFCQEEAVVIRFYQPFLARFSFYARQVKLDRRVDAADSRF
jgi:hypothetical protein